MSDNQDFEGYLAGKGIDSGAFRHGEPEVWEAWKKDFLEMHPASFTLQKLNLINPIRRKYLLKIISEAKSTDKLSPAGGLQTSAKPGKPLMKPKTN